MFQAIIDELSNTFPEVPAQIAAVRLIAALTLGSIIGLERERKGKPAGLRTNMLVALAACLFILVSQELATMSFSNANVQLDPLRLIEAVTSGVAFLAAGIIFTSGGKVQNITTGASLWLSGAIGLACGTGQIPLAAMATFIVVVVLFVIGHLEKRVN
ncbi:MgtC/SapB family protein [Marivivens aquimaris]|uniref:MgtC/SapB family protein n=1 Tax=Marivivens aquimaris TaxID=2774876 RepID=UPI001881EAE6|nr:MgtC/SapB family protein [Marivivens aquimaris]